MKVIAFIPVRGGSKSIPLKNIKLFCGKPLVCWNIEALELCDDIAEIIVATDSDDIARVVASQPYLKTKIYRRSAENAQDRSSTESVMIEYISNSKLDDNAIFMLVQATSPLTETHHFQQALDLYKTNSYDSILSCVRSLRFFWKDSGESLNYDYKNRPRRQDFHGLLMENGAFYINTVYNIKRDNNRLSGKIGIYEMPEYTANEIDEPDDWIILENLMNKHVLSKRNCLKKKIKLFLTDVDGTMTDGGMYYSEDGIETKKFNTRDGMGFQILREAGIKTGIITSEITSIVENRARKLAIDFLYQGKKCGGKLTVAQDICNQIGITFDEVAYIGDDINCSELLSAVGLAACPADACEKIKHIQNIHIMSRKGGDGCVREFIDRILQ